MVQPSGGWELWLRVGRLWCQVWSAAHCCVAGLQGEPGGGCPFPAVVGAASGEMGRSLLSPKVGLGGVIGGLLLQAVGVILPVGRVVAIGSGAVWEMPHPHRVVL